MATLLERDKQASRRARGRLIWTFAQRDLKARFTATSLGLVWTIIVPLATVMIYSVVFSVIFRAQAPDMGNGRSGVFAAWFFCGLVTWNLFSQVSGAGLGAILGMGAMMQKVFIPSYIPVVSAGLSVAIERLLEAGVMLVVMLAVPQHRLDVAALPLLARSAGGLRVQRRVHARGGQRPFPGHGTDLRNLHPALVLLDADHVPAGPDPDRLAWNTAADAVSDSIR